VSEIPQILMYSNTWCSYCERARALLARKAIPYQEIRLDEMPDRRQEMIERSGGRRSVPQIFIGNSHAGGFEELYELDRSGELDRLLCGAA